MCGSSTEIRYDSRSKLPQKVCSDYGFQTLSFCLGAILKCQNICLARIQKPKPTGSFYLTLMFCELKLSIFTSPASFWASSSANLLNRYSIQTSKWATRFYWLQPSLDSWKTCWTSSNKKHMCVRRASQPYAGHVNSIPVQSYRMVHGCDHHLRMHILWLHKL